MLSATIRDIAIIVIAVQSIVVGILIGVLIWQIWRLVKIIQNELKPIIEDTQATANTVRGTATFVSETVINPVIRTNRAVARWTGMARALTGELRSLMPRRRGGSHAKTQSTPSPEGEHESPPT